MTITDSQLEKLLIYVERCRVEEDPGNSAELALQILEDVKKQNIEEQDIYIEDVYRPIYKDDTCTHGLRTACRFCSIPCKDRAEEKINNI